MSEPPITLFAGSYSHTSNGYINRVVIHDEEYDTGPDSAEAVAHYFHYLAPNAYASCHYVVDQNSEQHCVPEVLVAYHAPPNAGSIGIEQDGYAHYSITQWRTPGAWATICRAAARTAELCIRYALPVVWLTSNDLVAGKRGITSHLNVSQAYRQSDHTDPGLQYPATDLIELVKLGVAMLADVKALQRDSGLTVDGIAGIVTITKLGDLLYRASTAPPAPPSPNNRFAGYPVIRLGARDPYLVGANTPKAPVQALQNTLNILLDMESRTNPHRLNPDGQFGAATNNVLRTWQARTYLTVDGIAGPQTWALLDYELDAKGR